MNGTCSASSIHSYSFFFTCYSQLASLLLILALFLTR